MIKPTISKNNYQNIDNDYDIELLYQFLEKEIGKNFTDFAFSFRDQNFPFWNESIINDDELIELFSLFDANKTGEIEYREFVSDLFGNKSLSKKQKK